MEVVLAPAQPDGLLAAFGPKEPGGFGDRRFSSPNQLTNGDDLFYGSSSPCSPFGLASVLSTPSPRAASLSRGSHDSGSVVDDGDESAAAADRRRRLARLALQYQEVVSRFELCLSYLADASNEAAALRRENGELRVANEDLTRRIKMVGDRLANELSCLRLAEGYPTPLRPLSPLPVAPALPKSISIRSPGYLKMNQNRKHRTSKPTRLGSVRSTHTPYPPFWSPSPLLDQSVYVSYLFVRCSQCGNPSSSACS
jgi:butyrate response factor 1